MHARRLFVLVPVATLGFAALTACGAESSSSNSGGTNSGSVTFTGDITGTWHKGGEASESQCEADSVLIHIIGPNSGDEGNLKVTSDGKVLVDIEKYGDFNAGSGATFHASKGFDIDADVVSARGKTAHVKGSLSC
ncbi:MAG TPA: hypothetical protein VJU79_05015 [Candidatus Dormibacteraeota bacterium]|nr:hypothetical protein [Candidatus Dormibacteraeota bacterium]